MKIHDEESACDTTDIAEIEQFLSRRLGGHNMFWLGHGQKKYPSITILVNGDLAHISYVPVPREPGFVSVGVIPCDADEMSRFFMGRTEEIWVAKYQLVPFSDALKVAREFATSESMPKCIRWEDLEGDDWTDHAK
jgi:hypothetical protein